MLRFLHIRPKTDKGEIQTRGGFTVAYEIDDLDQVSHWSFARCSTKDNFCKATGRTVAGGRLKSKVQSRRIIPCAEKAFIASVVNILEKSR